MSETHVITEGHSKADQSRKHHSIVEMLKEVASNNITWLIVTLVTVGIFVGTVLSLKENLAEVKQSINSQEARVDSMGESIAKIEVYQENIKDDQKDIKDDIDYIKRIITDNGSPKMYSGMMNLDEVIASECNAQ